MATVVDIYTVGPDGNLVAAGGRASVTPGLGDLTSRVAALEAKDILTEDDVNGLIATYIEENEIGSGGGSGTGAGTGSGVTASTVSSMISAALNADGGSADLANAVAGGLTFPVQAGEEANPAVAAVNDIIAAYIEENEIGSGSGSGGGTSSSDIPPFTDYDGWSTKDARDAIGCAVSAATYLTDSDYLHKTIGTFIHAYFNGSASECDAVVNKGLGLSSGASKTAVKTIITDYLTTSTGANAATYAAHIGSGMTRAINYAIQNPTTGTGSSQVRNALLTAFDTIIGDYIEANGVGSGGSGSSSGGGLTEMDFSETTWKTAEASYAVLYAMRYDENASVSYVKDMVQSWAGDYFLKSNDSYAKIMRNDLITKALADDNSAAASAIRADILDYLGLNSDYVKGKVATAVSGALGYTPSTGTNAAVTKINDLIAAYIEENEIGSGSGSGSAEMDFSETTWKTAAASYAVLYALRYDRDATTSYIWPMVDTRISQYAFSSTATSKSNAATLVANVLSDSNSNSGKTALSSWLVKVLNGTSGENWGSTLAAGVKQALESGSASSNVAVAAVKAAVSGGSASVSMVNQNTASKWTFRMTDGTNKYFSIRVGLSGWDAHLSSYGYIQYTLPDTFISTPTCYSASIVADTGAHSDLVASALPLVTVRPINSSSVAIYLRDPTTGLPPTSYSEGLYNNGKLYVVMILGGK